MRKRNVALAVGSFLTAAGLFAGCSGGTDNPETGADFAGTSFVADETTVGSITLEVENRDLAVGDTSSFSVFVRNSSGGPIGQISVSCDTEVGLVIVEPSTGSELTDSWGHMSGIVGCNTPGSFQMACRLPIGANKRKFVTIHCSGDEAGSLTGAGGGLGGSRNPGGGSTINSNTD
jgi:hypothetical protein